MVLAPDQNLVIASLIGITSSTAFVQRTLSGNAKDLLETDTCSPTENVSVLRQIRGSLPFVSIVLGALALVA